MIKLFVLITHLFININFKRRIQFGLIIFLMIVNAGAEVLSLGAVIPFLSVLTNPETVFQHSYSQQLIIFLDIKTSRQLILPITFLFCSAVIFAGIIRFILLWSQTTFSFSVGHDLSVKIYRRTLYDDYKVQISRNTSEVITAVATKASNVVNGIIMPCSLILSSTITLVAVVIALLNIEPRIAIISFGSFGVIYVLINLAVRKKLNLASFTINIETDRVVKTLQEGLGGIRDVLIDGTQEIFCNTYRSADLRKRRAEAMSQMISSSPRIGIETFGISLLACIAYVIVNKNESISNFIPIMGALALGAQRILPIVNQIYTSLAHIQVGKDYLKSALTIINTPIPYYAIDKLKNSLSYNHEIKLTNISFKFSEDSAWILNNVNLRIPKGSKIGIIGETGSGKSTLIDILMSLLSPNDGCIAIDDTVLKRENSRAWQAHISHVPQNIFLTDATIKENIAFGITNEKIDLNKVKQAANLAQIANTIESWKDKYNTICGERGVRLSGGQKQRIGLARAFYKKTDVLILDEATSALDNNTETSVMNAINKISKKMTIIIVAHRLSTLSNCDFIIEVKDGTIKKVVNVKK